MKLTIEIPEMLCRQLGKDLNQASMKEAMAIGLYQEEKLSIGQVAEFLGISIYEAEGLMKKHHVDALYTISDFEKDRNTLKRVLES